MKTIQSTDYITIKITDKELIEGKWLNFLLLSKKLSEIERNQNSGYKSLRNKFYNSSACNKYNTAEIAGLKCIDVDKPMKATASLALTFERVKNGK